MLLFRIRYDDDIKCQMIKIVEHLKYDKEVNFDNDYIEKRFLTLEDINNDLVEQLLPIMKEYDIKSIQSNTVLTTILHESKYFEFNTQYNNISDVINSEENIFKIGIFNNANLIIDKTIPSDDNRLFLTTKSNILLEINIKKIH